MSERSWPWRSLLLAPFASIPVVTFSGLGISGAGIGSDIFSGLLFGTVIGLPCAYLGLAIFACLYICCFIDSILSDYGLSVALGRACHSLSCMTRLAA